MKRFVNPLPFERHNELLQLTNMLINERVKLHAAEIEALGLSKPINASVAVANVNDYCLAVIDRKLPEWLKRFLENCYADANDQLQKRHRSNTFHLVSFYLGT